MNKIEHGDSSRVVCGRRIAFEYIDVTGVTVFSFLLALSSQWGRPTSLICISQPALSRAMQITIHNISNGKRLYECTNRCDVICNFFNARI